jgi:WYL domain
MNKNLTSATATTFTTDPALAQLDGPDAAELVRPHVWSTTDEARVAVRMFEEFGDMYRVIEHAAPGLEIFAIYRTGLTSAGEPEWVLMSVVEISDDTAARFHRAVRREFPVTVSYVKADGEETVRTIEPTSVQVTKSGALLVKALDRKSGEARSFRLDRVQAYTVHRTRRTVRTEAPAPTKAQLWEQWNAHQREFAPSEVVAVQSWTGSARYVSRTAYDTLLAARDPREPKAADEAISYAADVYDTTPGTATALQAPEAVQDQLAEAYASGRRYAFITV